MTKRSKALAFILALLLAFSLASPALAVDKTTLKADVDKAAAYISKTVTEPQVGSIGGEWAVVGLARSGSDIPKSYYQSYYATVEKYVEACKGILHEKKYTEYSRVILALTAIGKDPSNVAGYNLLTPLGDYDKTIWQGLNGPIWALIALDSGNYTMPVNSSAKTQATREMYVNRILACQLPDGGFSLFGGTNTASAGDTAADPDITGMALQALAKYQNRADVKKVTDEALARLSKMQDKNGGYASWGSTNSESVVQILVALTELGIPLDDSRFVKDGHTLLDNLLTYQMTDGSFRHTSGGDGSNQMASEQGFYGIVAALRVIEGKNSLYRISDAIQVGEGTNTGPVKGTGLTGKNADVKAVPITAPGTTFTDVVYSDAITAIEALAARGIITGLPDGTFAPDATMTRAQFAAIVVRALGLRPQTHDIFSDVPQTEWYASYVGTAYTYGIITGRTSTTFDPLGTITRQEAAVMLTRAAKLCGMPTDMDTATVRDTLAQFEDYVKVSDWAKTPLAFCYSSGILDQAAVSIQPTQAVTRAEIAQMLFNLLSKSNLL